VAIYVSPRKPARRYGDRQGAQLCGQSKRPFAVDSSTGQVGIVVTDLGNPFYLELLDQITTRYELRI